MQNHLTVHAAPSAPLAAKGSPKSASLELAKQADKLKLNGYPDVAGAWAGAPAPPEPGPGRPASGR